MQIADLYIDALDRVLASDLPDEAYPVAITAEAGHLAALESDLLGVESD